MRRYYIVDRDRLGEYGDERGSETAEEAQALLDQTEGDLVVIYGEELARTFAPPVEP